MKTLLLLLTLAASAFSQTTVNMPTLTVSADATAALNTWMSTQSNGSPTTITGAVQSGDTTITVALTTRITNNRSLAIDNEVMDVVSIAGNVITVTRATMGTTAAAHSKDAVVTVLKYQSIKNLFKSLISDNVSQIMDLVGSPSIATQKSAITTANSAIATLKNNAVQ